MPDFIVSGRSIDGTVYAMRQSPSRYGWTDSKAEATRFTQAEAARVVAARQAANNVSPADSIIGHLKAKPEDSAVCRWHALDSTWHGRSGYVGINESQRLYVIPCGDGFSTLGFDYAERKRRAVLAWLGKGALNAEPGTGVAYDVYLEAMRAGAEHAAATGTRCPAELIPALVEAEAVARRLARRRFAVTFEIVTAESAAHGDAAESGWISRAVELREAVADLFATRTSRVGGIAAIEPSDSEPRGCRWITVYNGTEFETGATESRALHLPATMTAASRARLFRLLKGV